jgi:hypothetical protein
MLWAIVLSAWLVAAVAGGLMWIGFRRTERRHVRSDPDEMPAARGWGGRIGDGW